MGHNELKTDASYWRRGGLWRVVPGALALLWATALVAHCSPSTRTIRGDSSGQEDMAVRGDVGADAGDNRPADSAAEGVPCPVDWTKLAYSNEYGDYAVATDRTNFVRPFFTMCENGGFYWSDWQFFPDGIDASEATSVASFVPCLSGECKWGICREDAEYFEKRLKGETVTGRLSVLTSMCRPCNPNNAAYSQKLHPDGGGDCEGGEACCSEPGPWEAPNGPCLEKRDTGFYLGVANPTSSFGFINYFHLLYSNEDPPPEDCKSQPEDPCPVQRAGRCIPNTSTLVATDWALSSGSIVVAGQRSTITKIRITMGAISRLGALMADPPKECPVDDKRKESYLKYFTCSGMAEMQIESGTWYRMVWVQKYAPADCDKPCWLAAGSRDGVPVEFTMEQIPAEEGW